MNDDLFNELVDSVREGAEILRDERQPARCAGYLICPCKFEP